VDAGLRAQHAPRRLLQRRGDEPACGRFLRAVARPLEPYEVAFAVEGLDLPDQTSVELRPVTFAHFDAAAAAAWGLDVAAIPALGAELVDRLVGIVNVRAGSRDKAVERATVEFDTALSALRVSLSSFPRFGIHDWQLLQRRSEVHAVKRARPGERALPGWRRGFKISPLDFRQSPDPAADPLLGHALTTAAQLKPLFDGRIAGKLAAQLRRALDAIGGSITRERDDDKVVDLCTALEALLATKADRRKAEAITARRLLLAATVRDAISSPFELYGLYLLRSEVVHGSSRDVCGPTEARLLFRIAFEVLVDLVAFLQQDPVITRHAGLLQAIDTPATRAKVLGFLDAWRGEPIDRVREWLSTVAP